MIEALKMPAEKPKGQIAPEMIDLKAKAEGTRIGKIIGVLLQDLRAGRLEPADIELVASRQLSAAVAAIEDEKRRNHKKSGPAARP